MNSYFANTANGDVIQTPISFESPKKTLNRATPIVGSLPFLSFREQRLGVCPIDLNNWFGSILPSNKLPQVLAAVASITYHVLRAKLAMSESGLAKNTAGCSDIGETRSRDIGNYGKFILGICQKVELIAEVVLYSPGCVWFHSPSSIGIRRRFFGSIRPRFQISAVNSYAFAEVREGIIEASGQATTDILDHNNISTVRQLTHKARIRKLSWNAFRTGYPTGYGNVGIILQSSYEAGEAWQAEDCHGDICFPKDFGCVSRPPCTSLQISNQIPIGYRIKDSVKLSNDWYGRLDKLVVFINNISSHGVGETSVTRGASLLASTLNIQFYGGGGGSRTRNQRILSSLLCRLSYSPTVKDRGVVCQHHSSLLWLHLKGVLPVFSFHYTACSYKSSIHCPYEGFISSMHTTTLKPLYDFFKCQWFVHLL